jgi:phosphoribosylanthranilate isomerase
MAVLLKTCGLTSLADARYCAGAGVDMLGFIFYEESPRAVTSTTVKEIAGWIHGPEIVGVFVDEATDVIESTASSAGLTMVQLHGDESPEQCAEISLPVIKAFRVQKDESPEALHTRIQPYLSVARYILLDTYVDGQPGGTGRTFDWSIATRLASEVPLLLSGGLNPGNVQQAVSTVRPLGVDLSSGIEMRPGVKDFDLIADVVDAFADVRETEPAFQNV